MAESGIQMILNVTFEGSLEDSLEVSFEDIEMGIFAENLQKMLKVTSEILPEILAEELAEILDGTESQLFLGYGCLVLSKGS